jgi:hypothetical protein
MREDLVRIARTLATLEPGSALAIVRGLAAGIALPSGR